jgi:hypothetical protein
VFEIALPTTTGYWEAAAISMLDCIRFTERN